VKEEVMRCCRLSPVALLFIVLLSISALGSELTVKVVDPASAVVSGARIEIFAEHSSRPAAIDVTSAQGTAHFSSVPDSALRLHVLAPGFAERWQPLTPDQADQGGVVTVALQLTGASETVVVSATRTPVPSDESGAALASLDRAELETIRPFAASDAVRFLPGGVVNTAGQRGGLSSLFVRGGESRYNKVIVDGVSITEPGGTFDFGTLPVFEADRLEFLRGTTSTLYGSDAMTSVVQLWSRTGNTSIPELRFGADGGNYGTANGYASLAGAHGRFDYDVFADQSNTSGSGPNADYSNSLQGGNLGANLTDWASLRLRIRHDHSATGVAGAWNFNGGNVFDVDGTTYTLLPDLDQRARQNNFLASLDLALKSGARWQHHFTGYEFNLKTQNIDTLTDPGHNTPFGELDTPFEHLVNINRAGFAYQGEYIERSWAQTVAGYEFEDENGSVTDRFAGSPPTVAPGLRLNQAAYLEQRIGYHRFTAIAGIRFVHNPTFGNTGVPRVSLAYRILRGGNTLSGTQLKASFATGIKEPRFEEAYGSGPFQIPNPHLNAERNRALEAGIEQHLAANKVSLTATYFNNLFHDQIAFVTVNPETFVGQYVNLQKSLAHGAEAVLEARLASALLWSTAYTYTSTQILQAPPGSFSPFAAGDPLLRRPHHFATTRVTYLRGRWGSTLAASFVGRRPDSDFEGFNIDHAPGYVRVDGGGWYALRPRITLYANLENLLNHSYQEVTGYPALGINFRAGVRFRVGGE
jgi:outer membrane cobalamin receptor